MKPRVHHVAFCAIAILAFGCQQAADQADQATTDEGAISTEADVAALHEHVYNWATTMTANDLEGTIALYGENPVAMPPFQTSKAGVEEIRSYFEEFYAQGTIAATVAPTEVYAADGWTFSYGTYSLTITPEGGNPVEDVGKWVDIGQRQPDGSFRTVRNLWNSDAPPPGAEPPLGANMEVGDVAAPTTTACVESLESVVQTFIDAFVAGDFDTAVALHTDDNLRLPPGVPLFQGQAALTTYFQLWDDAFETRELSISDEGHRQTGDRGASWGNFDYNYTPTGGGDPITGNGKYMFISEKGDDGCWRADWVTWNANEPPQSDA